MLETGLKDKVVVVTGGVAGIGRATAQAFAAEGARVEVWDIVEGIDVARQESVDAATAAVIAKWSRIDVLVNNAGILRDATLAKMTDEAFDAVINVNLKGVFHCTRAVVPHMIAAGGGVILNASSVVGLYGNFGQTNYTASKAGVIAMTRTWARELGKHNIRVNAVAPGFVDTDILKSMPEKVIQSAIARVPLGRMGKPEEIANTYVWLASDLARYVHGAVISVDGGIVVGT